MNDPKKPLTKKIRQECRELWAKVVKQRDGWQCQLCGRKAENAHHIIPKVNHNRKIFDLRNGIALCWKCHKDVAHGDAVKFADFVKPWLKQRGIDYYQMREELNGTLKLRIEDYLDMRIAFKDILNRSQNASK